jgi:hypothetical protein
MPNARTMPANLHSRNVGRNERWGSATGLALMLLACGGEDAPPSDAGAGGTGATSGAAGSGGTAGALGKGGAGGSAGSGKAGGAGLGGSSGSGATGGSGATDGGSGSGATAGGSLNGGAGGSASGSGGTTNASGGASGGGDGTLLDGMCRPNCVESSSDPDGDGWGWENEQSCVVVGSAPYNQGTRCDAGGGTGGSDTTGGSSGSGGSVATGGTGGSSGSSGTAGTGGSGGSGGSECGVAPVNPNASPQAKKLLCYLYGIYGKNVLSGQQETSWNNPQNDISWYNTNTGKYPAILGGDYLYPDGTTDRARAYWEAGGIPMIRYHMGAPPNSDTYENSQGTADIGAVLTDGTSQNRSFIEKLDYVSDELQQLEDANVAVLWAPFHEYQPNGWFWWSKGTAQQFIELWRTMYRYLTETKGLDNLVWLAPSSGSPNAQWYPGKEYLDVAGPDTYATNPPFTAMFAASRNIIGPTVPITLHETGVVVQPDTMFPDTAPWVLFSVWAGYQISENTVGEMQSAYESSYTLTRDEVPDLK